MNEEVDEKELDVLMDHVALEAMHAIESKDKAAFKEAFEVLVLNILNKLQQEPEEAEEGK